jgi:hypothetical protein
MNLGHIEIIKGNINEAFDFYIKSYRIMNSLMEFDVKMYDAFPHLEKQGVTRETFDEIVATLKQQNPHDEPPA